jgi:hypothetical protein
MFPHFWVSNPVNSTSLLCHPIHILPHKLVCACNIKSKGYSRPKTFLQQEKKKKKHLHTWNHRKIKGKKKKFKYISFRVRWTTIEKNVRKGNAKALKLPRHQHWCKRHHTPRMMINIVEDNKNQEHVEKNVDIIDSKNHRRRKWVEIKQNGELLAREEDEMTTTRNAISWCLLKPKRNQKEKRTLLRRLYNGRRKKIMQKTLLFHVGEGHEDKKPLTHIGP